MSLAFVFAFVESAIVLILLAVFGNDSQRPVEIANVVVPHALTTAVTSPLMFRLAQRLRPGAAPVGASEAGRRRAEMSISWSSAPTWGSSAGGIAGWCCS